MRHFITSAAIFTLTTVTGPSWAQTVNAEDAAGIQAAIVAGLPVTPKLGNNPFEHHWAGESRVVPAEDHYDVTLPALTITAEGTKKFQFDVGAIQLKLAPKSDATYTVDVTVPSRMTVREDGVPTATYTIGKQRFTGLWSSTAQNFLTADVEYGDLVVTESGQEGALRAASLTIKQNLQPVGPDLWNGSVNTVLNTITLTGPQEKTVMSIGDMGIDFEYNRINSAKVIQLKEMIKAHNAADTPLLFSQYLPLLGQIFGDMSFIARTHALVVHAGKDEVSIDKVSFSLGVRNMDGETSAFTLGLMGDGLKASWIPGPKKFMPERFDAQLTLDKLPNAALGQTILELAKQDERPEKPDYASTRKAHKEMGEKLLDAAERAGTELRIERLALNTPATSGSVTGAAQVKAQATFYAIGGVEIVLRGLDVAAAALKGVRKIAPVIPMLQMLGQQSKDAAGKELRTYKLELAEGGQIMLNGADIGAFLSLRAPSAASNVDEDEDEKSSQPGPTKN